MGIKASWHPKTARTLLSRLVRKKALSYETRGRVYYYAPLATEAECIATESESFLGRVFHGSLTPMLAHFVERRALKSGEIEELRRLLSRASRDNPDRESK